MVYQSSTPKQDAEVSRSKIKSQDIIDIVIKKTKQDMIKEIEELSWTDPNQVDIIIDSDDWKIFKDKQNETTKR